MTDKFVFDLFPSYFKTTPVADNTIEIFDFHECEYGEIFYQGQLISNYQGENYYSKLHSHKLQKKLIAAGLDLKKAKAFYYDFGYILHYNHLFSHFDRHSNYDNYSKLFNDIKTDLTIMQPLISSEEKRINNLNPSLQGKALFISSQELDF